MHLIKRLKLIGITDNNKGIRSYWANGLDGSTAIKTIRKAALNHPEIPDDAALPLALVCANRHLNGSQLAGFTDQWLRPLEQVQKLVTDQEQLLRTYEATKPETLDKYRRAAKAIDEVRGFVPE